LITDHAQRFAKNPTESDSVDAAARKAPAPENTIAADKKKTTQDSSYSNYLFGTAGSSDAPAWSDTVKGRIAIRAISRGIFGSIFFVVGGRMATMQMKGYNQENFDWSKPKPFLQYIAKGIDTTLGKGIQKTVQGVASLMGKPNAEAIGKAAVTFRESRHFNGAVQERGRSYGSDIVNFTFDFAMASIGDATTRNVIQAIDPNVKQTWKVNDQGEMAKKGENWHFLPGEFLKWSGKTAWRVLTKNQGEDWAAAIPYAFQMKWQRSFLSNVFSKRWEGHKLVFDRNWNGGAWKINQQGQIVGDYQFVGGIDLHARFVGYNWYTLMFRETYDTIGRKFNEWKDSGYQLSALAPEHMNPIRAAIDSVRYVTKSFIKANMYMNPAVLFFWPMRVAQNKWKGKFFIEEGMQEFNPATDKRAHIWEPGGLDPYASKNYEHYATKTPLDKFEKGFGKYVLNPMGWTSFNVGKRVANGAEWLHNKGVKPRADSWTGKLLKGDTSNLLDGGRRFAHEVVDTSFSYTPYMYAKQEFGLRVDDNKGDGKLGQMDVAIYKFMDDVVSLKFREIPKDLKSMWKLGSNFEREVKAREGGGEGVQEAANDSARKKPQSTVHASSVRGEGRQHEVNIQRPAANDASMEEDRSWARSVVGSDIHPARIHSSSPTLH
jgi:hypothetical protein